jgi:rhodanese-related sulfurtransferase
LVINLSELTIWKSTRKCNSREASFPLSKGRASAKQRQRKVKAIHMYRGDIPPQDAFQRLSNNSKAVLVDVRTQPEWTFVGVPNVERLVRVSWQVFPEMNVNGGFVEQIETLNLPKDSEILCICRSGARSASAATALTNAGYTNCWNVAQGFEGDKDGNGQRGRTNGWKAANLPWVQS